MKEDNFNHSPNQAASTRGRLSARSLLAFQQRRRRMASRPPAPAPVAVEAQAEMPPEGPRDPRFAELDSLIAAQDERERRRGRWRR